MAYDGDYRKRLREIADEIGRPLNLICYDMDRNHSFLSDVINGRQNGGAACGCLRAGAAGACRSAA